MRALGLGLYLSATVHVVAIGAMLVGFPGTGSSPDQPDIVVTELIFEASSAQPESRNASIEVATHGADDLPGSAPATVGADKPVAADPVGEEAGPMPASGTPVEDNTATPFREEPVVAEAVQMASSSPVGPIAAAQTNAPPGRPEVQWHGPAPRNKPAPPPHTQRTAASPLAAERAVAALAPQALPTGSDAVPHPVDRPTASPPPVQSQSNLTARPSHGAVGAVPSDTVETVPAQYAGIALGNRSPAYPYAARRIGVEGRVVIGVTVGRDGFVANAAIAESSGHRLLDRAALEAVRNWRFIPAKRAGQPVASTIAVPIVFRLANESAPISK